MKVRIKRLDKSLPLPAYETGGSVGFDILAGEDKNIQPKEITLIKGNVIVETPLGYMLMIAPRSSTPRKKGLAMPHSVGILDQDYCGPEDELLLQMMNFTDSSVDIKKGEKIAQGIFVRVDVAEWEEVDEVKKPTRGGYGSTGGYHK